MKIAVQTGRSTYEIGLASAYRMYAEAGFESLDWNVNDSLPSIYTNKGRYEESDIYGKSIDEILAFLNEELTEIRKNGLAIGQAHAPFPAYITGKPEVLDYMIEVYKKNIQLCERVGCKYLVIHGISLSKKDRENTPESIRALNDKLYKSLIPTLLENDVIVCLENLFTKEGGEIVAGVCSNPYDAVEMIDEYNKVAGKECFGFCFDTGHLNLLKQDMRSYIPVLGSRIKVLHVHDNDGISDQHKAPYTGTIVWQDFCDELKKVGYSGDISFETFNQTSLRVIDHKLLAPWLKLICEIGDFFRDKISKR